MTPYYSEGGNIIYNLDCREVLRDMPANSIATIITDPPYHLTTGKQGGTGTASLNVDSPAGRSRVGTGFMGKAWDGGDVAFQVSTWQECLRVAKPGAMLLAFGGTRTYHRLACSIENAGWEIRDGILWLYGSGFPKSLDISKAIDKQREGNHRLREFADMIRERREIMGISKAEADKIVCGGTTMYSFFEGRTGKPLYFPNPAHYAAMKALLGIDDSWDDFVIETNEKIVAECDGDFGFQQNMDRWVGKRKITEPATDAAKLWNGWGTALKPAWEPIIVAMKPLDGTFAENAKRHGVAGLNIAGGRIGTNGETIHLPQSDPANRRGEVGCDLGIASASRDKNQAAQRASVDRTNTLGRWPANVVLDEVAAAMLDEQSGELTSSAGMRTRSPSVNCYGQHKDTPYMHTGDTGGASRFFYTAKASRSERERHNVHPTVKPLALMKYLCTLTATPTGGVVLDPFAGSGSTLIAARDCGRCFVGIEQDASYCAIAVKRLRQGVLFGGAA